MRCLALVAAALAAPVLPVLAAAPAFAADNVICVPVMVAGCDQSAATIPLGVTAANGNTLDDLIRVAPGTYNDGPYVLNGTSHALTLQGAGRGSDPATSTILTLPASGVIQNYVAATQATVQSVRVQMNVDNSANDVGLSLVNAAADHVTVVGSGTSDARGAVMSGSDLTDSSIQMPSSALAFSTGIYGQGGNEVTDTDISGAVGFTHSNVLPDSLSRVTITAEGDGVRTDFGTVEIDDAVIDLGAGTGTGLNAANYNNSADPKAINANHVTVVGGGDGSIGVWAYAAASGAKQTSTIQLHNSIVRGPTLDLAAQAANDGAQGGNSTATITTTYSDWATSAEIEPSNGTAEVAVGAGHLDVDPAFVNAAGGDYRLSPGSPVVDKGDPAAGGPALDRAGAVRVADGDAVLGAVRDMGAYERPDTTPPDTTITSGPTGPTSDATPTFAFTSEAGATFECRVDAAAYSACPSPFTTPTLAGGAHAVAVRAKDPYGNVDASPATRTFTVDTTAPDTTITKPAKRTTKAKVKLVFSSEAGATFQCQVDGKAWKSCTSPLKLKVKQGKHVVLVRAVDAVGNTDATPARVKFRRVPRPR